MTADTESLVLDILKKIQADGALTRRDLLDIKLRLGSIEGHMALMQADIAHIHQRLDDLGGRIERIENRLELAD